MIKYDIGKVGKELLSLYVTKNETKLVNYLVGKWGFPTARYYNKLGVCFAFEWWIHKNESISKRIKTIINKYKVKK